MSTSYLSDVISHKLNQYPMTMALAAHRTSKALAHFLFTDHLLGVDASTHFRRTDLEPSRSLGTLISVTAYKLVKGADLYKWHV